MVLIRSLLGSYLGIESGVSVLRTPPPRLTVGSCSHQPVKWFIFGLFSDGIGSCAPSSCLCAVGVSRVLMFSVQSPVQTVLQCKAGHSGASTASPCHLVCSKYFLKRNNVAALEGLPSSALKQSPESTQRKRGSVCIVSQIFTSLQGTQNSSLNSLRP